MRMRVGFCLLALLLALPLPASAQFPPPAPSASAPEFPSLPPSKPCTKDDIIGLWQLVSVYEAPAGRELADFKAFPYQYLLFTPNNTYATENPQRPGKPEDMVRSLLGQSSPVLQQYVVSQSGFVFFYQNRVATDTQACFIAANRTGKFWPGQMLIMPPEGQHVGRLVKVYGKRWTPPQPGAQKQTPPRRSWPPKRK